jgi:biopolymer transport protein TolQ
MELLVSGAAMGGRLAGLDVLGLVAEAGTIVKLVLFVLASFSIISWAVIGFKWREFRRADQDNEAFLEVYHDGSLDAAYQAARDLDRSPASAVFLSAYAELVRIAKLTGKRATLSDTHIHALSQKLAWGAAREGLRLERGMSFLATTASATVYIGLFGTVVGIINAFEGIGRAGNASLAVVAPGIAEALIATAAGLFAAIPATILYNHFTGELRRITASIELFAEEFEGDLRQLGEVTPRSMAADA